MNDIMIIIVCLIKFIALGWMFLNRLKDKKISYNNKLMCMSMLAICAIGAISVTSALVIYAITTN